LYSGASRNSLVRADRRQVKQSREAKTTKAVKSCPRLLLGSPKVGITQERFAAPDPSDRIASSKLQLHFMGGRLQLAAKGGSRTLDRGIMLEPGVLVNVK
jgi:hypothetical protein